MLIFEGHRDHRNFARHVRTDVPDMNARTLVDARRRRIAVWFGDVAAAPEWLVYDQIRSALHLASRGRSFGMFHAAALRYGGIGCLITCKRVPANPP